MNLNISPGAIALLALLRSYGQQIFPRQATLAARLGVGVRTINRHMSELKKAGWIEVHHRGPRSSSYRLLSHRLTEQNGVASPDREISTTAVENTEENLLNGVACGVAFGVASAPHLLLRGLSTAFCSSSRRVVVGDDGCLKSQTNEPTPRTANERQDLPKHVSVLGVAMPKEACLSLAVPGPPRRRPPRPDHHAIADLARAKAVGGSP